MNTDTRHVAAANRAALKRGYGGVTQEQMDRALAVKGYTPKKASGHTPQPALSRRQRRLASKGDRRAARDAQRAVRAQDQAPVVHDWSGMTLTVLRKTAQDRGLRVNGKRPSLCTKAELIAALA